MSNTNIGWIGLGNMGTPMCLQLIRAGLDVTVYNRSKERETALTAGGARAADTPEALIQQSAVVFLMVSDDAAIDDLFTSYHGLLGAGVTGRILINMSTVSPGISREMAALCRQQGNAYLDAPVSGSVKQAEEAQLVIMAGGEEAVFGEVKPLLEHMGRLVMLVGGHGAGNTAKLAINALLAVYAQGLAESVVFARRHGLDTADLLTLIHNSALGNVFTRIKGEAILREDYKAAFALRHIAKDLGLARGEGMQTPLAATAHDTFRQAAPGLGNDDIIGIIRQLDTPPA